MTKHVEIAGAGFAGLTAAIALRKLGWSVRVHERGKDLRALGAGIVLWRNSIEILKDFGLYDQLRSGSHRPPFYETRVHNKTASKETFWDVDYLTMSRAHLHRVLANGARDLGVEILTDSQVIGATPEGQLHLEGGKQTSADLIVGADGVHSKVRDSMSFKYDKWGSRDGIVRVLIPRDRDYIGGDWDNVIDMWNFVPRTIRILYVPCNEDQLYLGLMAPNEDLDASRIPIDVEVWSEIFPEMRKALERVAALPNVRRDTYETRVLDRWTDGNVALIGDAAHAMCPALAQGAGSAMVNAYTLAHSVSEPVNGDLASSLKAWETEFRPLTDRCQERSRIFMETRTMALGNRFTSEVLETAAFNPVEMTQSTAKV